MPNWFKVIQSASAKEPVEILIYDQIGQDWFGNSGVNAKDFAEALKEIPKDQKITVAINSPGGNVWDGLAIYHQLQARKDYVTTRVDGIAASIASVIALAGREVQMPKNSLLMIHDPSGMVMGNAEDFRKMANELDLLANNLADIYARKTGKTKQEMRAAMQAETFYTGEEAFGIRLADTLLEESKIAAHFDLSAFQRMLATLKQQNKTAAQAGGANKGNEMNKTQIVALLTKHGVTVEASATDEQLMAILGDTLAKANAKKEPATPTAPVEPANVVALQQAIASLQAANEAERKTRLKRDVTSLAEAGHIPMNAVDGWTARALKDETIIDEIKKLPIYASGVDPIFNVITNEGNPLVEAYKKMKPGAARNAFRLENQSELAKVATKITNQADMERIKRHVGNPQDVNTLAAALVTDYLADGLITVASSKLAPMAAYSRNFGTDPMKPRATVQVNKATVGSSTLTNATNFESGDTTIAAVAVTVNQLTQAFHLTNDQLNKGYQMANLAGITADTLCNSISDLVTALFVVGNYANTAVVIGAVTAFDPSDLPAIFDTAKNFRQRNLLLSGGHLSALFPGIYAPTAFGIGVNPSGGSQTVWPGALGFDLLAMQNRWTSATANSVGFVCSPDAVAVASGLPIGTPSQDYLTFNTVTIDGAGTNTQSLGLSIQYCTWWSRSARTIFGSFDIMFGVSVGDGTAGTRLVSA